jgi:hypothetical protein
MTWHILKTDLCHRCPQKLHTKQLAFDNFFHHSLFDKTEHTKADFTKGTSLVTEQRNMNRECETLSDGSTCRTFQRRWYITCPMVDRTRITTPPPRCPCPPRIFSGNTHTKIQGASFHTNRPAAYNFFWKPLHPKPQRRPEVKEQLSESFQQLWGTLNGQIIQQRLELPCIWVTK